MSEHDGSGPGPGDPLAFVHVMKCGGTSLRQALTRATGELPAGDQRRDLVELGGESVTFTAGLLGVDDWRVRDVLVTHALLQPTTRVAMGHLRWVDELAPLAERHVHFVTVLREPVERFVSLYRFRTYGHRPYLRFDGSIEDFLEQRPDVAAQMGRTYVELFRGGTGDHDRPVADGDVDAAVQNLARFSVVGMLDELGDFERQVRQRAGLPISMPHLNPNEADRPTLDPDTRRTIEDLCRPNTEVYERVRRQRRDDVES